MINSRNGVNKMLDKSTYLQTKNEIKSYCPCDIRKFAKDMMLNKYESDLLTSFANDDTRIATCIKLGISRNKYTSDLKKLVIKIINYKNTH